MDAPYILRQYPHFLPIPQTGSLGNRSPKQTCNRALSKRPSQPTSTPSCSISPRCPARHPRPLLLRTKDHYRKRCSLITRSNNLQPDSEPHSLFPQSQTLDDCVMVVLLLDSSRQPLLLCEWFAGGTVVSYNANPHA